MLIKIILILKKAKLIGIIDLTNLIPTIQIIEERNNKLGLDLKNSVDMTEFFALLSQLCFAFHSHKLWIIGNKYKIPNNMFWKFKEFLN